MLGARDTKERSQFRYPCGLICPPGCCKSAALVVIDNLQEPDDRRCCKLFHREPERTNADIRHWACSFLQFPVEYISVKNMFKINYQLVVRPQYVYHRPIARQRRAARIVNNTSVIQIKINNKFHMHDFVLLIVSDHFGQLMVLTMYTALYKYKDNVGLYDIVDKRIFYIII